MSKDPIVREGFASMPQSFLDFTCALCQLNSGEGEVKAAVTKEVSRVIDMKLFTIPLKCALVNSLSLHLVCTCDSRSRSRS